jgi:methyl-accepting chemotaxis protein
MNAGQLAALIAAVSFAILAGTAVFVLIRLSRLLSAAAALLGRYRASSQQLQDSAAAVVLRADQQLARTAALTDSVDQVSASMAELSARASAVAATARGLQALLSAPLLRLAALRFGVGHAIAVRRPGARP